MKNLTSIYGRNIYYNRGVYSEMELTYKGNKYSIKIDTAEVGKLIPYKWNLTFVGRVGHKSPSVYSYINNKRVTLNRWLMQGVETDKIIFINRNQFDYRLSNLSKAKKGLSQFRDRNSHGQLGMHNIVVKYNKNNEIRAYVAIIRDKAGVRTKTFSIKKIGSQAEALEKAKEFRDMQSNCIK